MFAEILNNNKHNNFLRRSTYQESFAYYFSQPKEEIQIYHTQLF